MPQTTKNILVTGTNGGLGFGICQRLIDDFLRTQPQTTSLNLIITTRSARKAQDTISSLASQLSTQNAATRQRISIQPESVELTNLLSVKALARKLNESDITQLDAIILNAGISGWSGLNWPMAIRHVVTAPRVNTTFPQFKIGMRGLVTKPQLPPDSSAETESDPEPPLGQIFCANVLGHYMLTHWLMPLLQACTESEPAKIIWISSIEPLAKHFREEDIQGLRSNQCYENTKRLTDILALTYDLPATSSATQQFRTVSSPATAQRKPRPALSTPTMYTTQPGILTSSIIALYPIVHQAYVAAIWLARFLGAPWSTWSSYTAAMSITWLALVSHMEVTEEEVKFGPNPSRNKKKNGGEHVKWGTGVTRLGVPSARPTEVEGWGLTGSGAQYQDTFWAGKLGRHPGAIDATHETVEEFTMQGARVWGEMEALRKEWEERIEKYEKKAGHNTSV